MTFFDETIFQSTPFELVAGPDRKSFWVHTELLAQHSPYFRALVYGEMLEAKERRARLDDTLPRTLRGFIEYIYSGIYTTEQPQVILQDPESKEAESSSQQNSEEGRDSPVLSRGSSRPSSQSDLTAAMRRRRPGGLQRERARMSADNMNEPFGGNRRLHLDSGSKQSRLWESFSNNLLAKEFKSERWSSRGNEDPSESYENVFLCHAELYVFGDRYGVAHLQYLALYRLWETLKVFHIYPERKIDLVQLVNYVYANTVDLEGGLDDMRHVMALYMACKAGQFIGDNDFASSMANHTSFARDLLDLLLERLD